MTKQEAIDVMKKGQAVTHRYFDEHEWVKSDPRGMVYTLEDGVTLNAIKFWQFRTESYWEIGWRIVENF